MQRVTQHFPQIQVLQPEDAWAAIVKGAVLSKLPDHAAVISTCAARHYGTRYGIGYDVSRDAGEETYLNRKGETRVTRMGWFLRTGDNILCDQRFEIPLTFHFDDIHSLGDLVRTSSLWQCEDKFAPFYPSKGKKLLRNCTVKGDLRHVAKRKFIPMTDTKGKLYYDLNINLVMTYKSAVMTFSMEVDGEEIGSTEVNYA
ncbi:hypothetical protein E4U30_000048 [Claviceps sp. LM220 group G6]|nr:hypothetical protein E4U30_000048 [Claviceps sp. LM220 group G6]